MATILAITTLIGITATAARAGDRSMVAQTLNQGLAGTPLAGQGYLIERAGWRYRVNPSFLAAITGAESSFGAATCYSNPRNAAGLASCQTGTWVPYFRTWGHFWMFLAKFIADRWPGVSSPWTIGYTYCPPCGSRWGDKVAYYQKRLGFAASARYPE